MKTMPLTDLIATLPKMELLIGTKCLNNDDDIVYITESDGGIWAGDYPNAEEGNYYRANELRYIID